MLTTISQNQHAQAMVEASQAARLEPRAHVPLHAIERLALTLSKGYTLVTGLASLPGLSPATALVGRWKMEVHDRADERHSRSIPLAFKLLPIAIPADSAQRVKESSNRIWEQGLGEARNDG